MTDAAALLVTSSSSARQHSTCLYSISQKNIEGREVERTNWEAISIRNRRSFGASEVIFHVGGMFTRPLASARCSAFDVCVTR